jgi:hypothetical protein
MFRIVCDPLSGNTELYLTGIIRSVSQMFVVCLVGLGTTVVSNPTDRTHTQQVQNYAAKHRPSTRQTTVNHYV